MRELEVSLTESPHMWAEEAFRALAPRLWRALFLYMGSGEAASDAVSEAFTQAMAARSEIRNPQAWIWRTAFKIAAGEMGRRFDEKDMPDVPASPRGDPESLLDLVRALGQISDMQRRALILRYYMGYSNVEIARILDSTPSSIGVQIFRSTRRLRAMLSEEPRSP
ncbi:MAG: RNA polymerase sigma factor [Actinomycetota bacterium]